MSVSVTKAEDFLHLAAAVKTDTLHELIRAEVVQPHFSSIPTVAKLLTNRRTALLQHLLLLIAF